MKESRLAHPCAPCPHTDDAPASPACRACEGQTVKRATWEHRNAMKRGVIMQTINKSDAQLVRTVRNETRPGLETWIGQLDDQINCHFYDQDNGQCTLTWLDRLLKKEPPGDQQCPLRGDNRVCRKVGHGR